MREHVRALINAPCHRPKQRSNKRNLPKCHRPPTPTNPVRHAPRQRQQPDLDAIRAEVLNPRSQYYYPKLMERYEKNETIMNLNDYRHLYYGYLFQEDFNPYRHSEASTKNESLYYKQGHTRAELDSIITYAHEALADNPFNLAQMNFLIYALRARGKVNLASIWQYRLNHLLQAIVSSGTGADKENAWFVIDPRHEYNIINFQNAVARHQEYEEPVPTTASMWKRPDQKATKRALPIISTYATCWRNITANSPRRMSSKNNPPPHQSHTDTYAHWRD